MPPYKTKAVVLRSYKLGEADKIIKLFSGEHGLIDAVAKGSRKLKSKFSGRLELFNFLELEMSQGRNLDVILQAEIIRSFLNISLDFNKFAFCQLIGDIIIKTHYSSAENNNSIFKLIYLCFNEINLSENIQEFKKTASFFIAKFLKIIGYIPDLKNCYMCKCAVEEVNRLFFSIKNGGIFCNGCASGIVSRIDLKIPLDQKKFRLLKSLFSDDFKANRNYIVDNEDLDSVFKILEEYLKFHAECNINFSAFLKRI
jgi:DNA repair protein RecO (recombination protein O)